MRTACYAPGVKAPAARPGLVIGCLPERSLLAGRAPGVFLIPEWGSHAEKSGSGLTPVRSRRKVAWTSAQEFVKRNSLISQRVREIELLEDAGLSLEPKENIKLNAARR
jgi:hypothetical protein